MAAPSHNHNAVSQDTLITIKISVNDNLKKIKLPLRDLGANVLPDKLRLLLGIKPEQTVIFERFSDSAGGYITLDPNSPQVFKTLIRAAKAKLKLRLKATVTPVEKKEEVRIEMAQKPVEPLIVSSPVHNNSPRDSTAVDRRSVGSGIFQFREARASQQTLVNTDEAPVPQAFTTNQKDFFNGLATHGNLAFRPKEPSSVLINDHGHPWSVYCNECDKAMSDAQSHFHCSICDGGDYDLCEDCVASGKLCPGEGHWLIKRFIKDGKVINSTTERISPRPRMSKPIKIEDLVQKTVCSEEKKEMPGAFAAEDTKALAEEPRVATRTCNSCVVVLPEREFVTCTACEDFDLCIACHTSNKHGHHPAHGFKPATGDTVLPLAAETMLAPGRNVRHNAICDGCDNKIYGVRHKCLNCPDWDYCSECVKDARHSHPRHRFAAIYSPIPDQYQMQARHFGIYCDGPLCNNKSDQSYITGVRYKCAVCHDTDFCASCEALPANHHNRTHPLIKFKTPVRNVSITTENEDLSGHVRMMGDRRQEAAAQRSTATETSPMPQANAATQVQTVAEIKPTEVKEDKPQPIPVVQSTQKNEPIVSSEMLNAHFVHDSIKDGMVLAPGARFTQIWTLKNPGPYAWPAGCSVRFTGGDNMLNVDNNRPASVTDIAEASESNVVGREVQVGEEVAFKVVLKAPVREGKGISYWRLKAADGTPFGHRLWCDIEVKVPEAPKPMAVKPAFASPFEAAQKANMMRYQMLRQQQMQQQMAARHQPQVNGQQAVDINAQLQLQQQQQAQRAAMMQQQQRMQQVMAAQQAQKQAMFQQSQSAQQPFPAVPSQSPPAYEATESALSSRLATMRAEQQRRREQMMATFNAQRDMPSAVQSGLSEADKARKEAAKQRVAHIKEKIMRTREERARMMEQQKQVVSSQKTADENEEKVKKIVEEVSKVAEKEDAEIAAKAQQDEEKLEGSQMVFPKLEKESPTSSTYQSATSSSIKGKAAYVENEEGEVEHSAAPASPSAVSAVPTVTSPIEERFEDFEDDFEVMSADGEVESEDDGFMTDEEYDILDASDNETVASK